MASRTLNGLATMRSSLSAGKKSLVLGNCLVASEHGLLNGLCLDPRALVGRSVKSRNNTRFAFRGLRGGEMGWRPSTKRRGRCVPRIEQAARLKSRMVHMCREFGLLCYRNSSLLASINVVPRLPGSSNRTCQNRFVDEGHLQTRPSTEPGDHT